MADTNNQNPSRRKFLSLGILAGAGLTTNKIAAQSAPVSGEQVKLLTKDGKLVTVDKIIVDTSAQKKPASKKDVLSWIRPPQ